LHRELVRELYDLQQQWHQSRQTQSLSPDYNSQLGAGVYRLIDYSQLWEHLNRYLLIYLRHHRRYWWLAQDHAMGKITGNSGASGVFTISSVSSSTQFVVTSCSGTGDSCTAGTFSGGTIYTGDYLPDTIPTAVAYYADTLEVFFCDWEFAFVASPISSCPAHNATYSADYASILTTP
jgi:hypothetical protein